MSRLAIAEVIERSRFRKACIKEVRGLIDCADVFLGRIGICDNEFNVGETS